jgi:hypothetical protein
MKAFAIISRVLSSVLVLAWPLVCFFSIFLFDAPLHGVENAERWIFACWLWTYPLGYLVAFGYVGNRRGTNIPWWKPPTAYLYLLPFAHRGLLGVVIFVNTLLFCHGDKTFWCG